MIGSALRRGGLCSFTRWGDTSWVPTLGQACVGSRQGQEAWPLSLGSQVGRAPSVAQPDGSRDKGQFLGAQKREQLAM